MTTSKNVTPAKYRCGLDEEQCPSIHETENGDIVFVGAYVTQGELKSMGIPYGTGESAVSFSREFVDAYLLEHLQRKIAGGK